MDMGERGCAAQALDVWLSLLRNFRVTWEGVLMEMRNGRPLFGLPTVCTM